MRGVATDPARELRAAIERLPLATRTAMLDAVRCPATRLIAGGYAARGGGVCPLLAAHRRGGRTHDASSGVSAFAGAWDRYTGTPTGDPRPVDDAERRALEGMLVASLKRSAAAERGRELSPPRRRSWLGVFRRYDDYVAALEAAGEDAGPPLARDEAAPAPAGFPIGSCVRPSG